MKNIYRLLSSLFVAVLVTFSVSFSEAAPFQKGDVKLQSIGPIATGSDGILFVSDPKAASIIAIKTTAEEPDKSSENFKVEGLDAIMIGPYDLSASMGFTAQFDHKEFRNTMTLPTARNCYGGSQALQNCQAIF